MITCDIKDGAVLVRPIVFSGELLVEDRSHPPFTGTNGFDYTDKLVHNCHI